MLGTSGGLKNNIFTRNSKLGRFKNKGILKIQLNVTLGKKYQVTALMLVDAAQNIFNCTAKYFNHNNL